MKVLVLSAVLAIALAAPYSTDNDDLDVEAIVCNPETLSKVTQCFLDKGPCSEVAAQFKSVLPDATATACSKCTPAQKHMLKRYLQQVKETSPDDLQALREKYDPDSQHIDALVAALKDA
ncbi:ejaculatory bulb-specific protein 3-like [Ostrinia furnacalis]|uniref:ejaculatory bulb-specific protein 3-like n=1 Tax=Ostrinia furnacalis TaxID=93504 RepID=UPI00103E6D95|nr:ejaculatory bulb-specific protein 3-like [Ostrinia furnacalis]